MLKIDFGSGYNPKSGYKTCDVTYAPFLDYVYDQEKSEILYCENGSVDEFHLRNVVHHVKDLSAMFECLKRYLKEDGLLTIIDVRKEYFEKNVILDIIWYRYVIPRYEVWFSREYRDYSKVLTKLGFVRIDYHICEEKEVSIWLKTS
jgi:hypothetical protein